MNIEEQLKARVKDVRFDFTEAEIQKLQIEADFLIENGAKPQNIIESLKKFDDSEKGRKLISFFMTNIVSKIIEQTE